MGYITTLIRLSVPAGAVYWTKEEGIWSPVTGSPDGQQRLQSHNQQLVQLRQKLIPDPRCYWNCGVKMTIRKIADFDADVQLQRLWKLLNDQTKSLQTEEKTASK